VILDDRLSEAQAVLAEGRWEEARELFATILAEGDSAEALDGMGTALWWLGHVRDSLDHRERAYAAYRAEQRHAEAVIVALDVSVSYLSNLDNPTVARGWIARARRAADLGGDERLTGWVWLMEGYTANDPQLQRDLTTRALARGRELGDVDLELGALADLGLALVVGGEVQDGLALLDEAMAGTLAGECQRLDTVVWASCSMLAACTLVGDQRRAAQWCSAAERFAERYGCPFLQARCRSHYGRVLVESGDWELAEVELKRALSMAADCGREPRVEAVAGLAQLRLRQGALAEAELLLAEADDAGDVVVAAELMTARGQPERAVAILAGVLESMAGNRSALAFPILTASLVDALLAKGDVDAAEAAAGTLAELSGHQHPQAAAVTDRASGRVAGVRGDTGRATRLLRRAIAAYDELMLPFQAARTRLELADILIDGEPDQAAVEAGHALDRMERLGARHEAAAAAALLRRLGVATRPGPRGVSLLSRRECDVLALVRDGLTNPQIGAELYISPRTVAHHVSSILAKLGLRTRAEAAAFAATHATQPGSAKPDSR
jgi:DNA-binding CsgD family transcriptional regulator/tetratricopeptide (TPR) repeat protein